MKDPKVRARGIIMGDESILAIKAGTKTQTRRIVRDFDRDTRVVTPWHVGQLLWVKEACITYTGNGIRTVYRADDQRAYDRERQRPWPGDRPWRSVRFMPKAAARFVLRVTAVRVERLHDVSEADAVAEGFATIETHFYTYLRDGDGPSKGATFQTLHPIPDEKLSEIKTEHGSGPLRLIRHDVQATSALVGFQNAWEELNRKRAPWRDNPWVAAISFERTDPALLWLDKR